MKLPHGYPNPHNHVCKLLKSLYGLKQASRQWFAKLAQELIKQDCKQSKNNYSLFRKRKLHSITILAIYVDDIILTGNDQHQIQQIKNYLDSVFSIKDLGKLRYFLGMKVCYLPPTVVLAQHKFAKEESGFDSFKKVVTPLPANIKLSASLGTLLPNPTPYRSLIGKLNFLTNTRPDLAYTVQTLSQFMQSPWDTH